MDFTWSKGLLQLNYSIFSHVEKYYYLLLYFSIFQKSFGNSPGRRDSTSGQLRGWRLPCRRPIKEIRQGLACGRRYIQF